MAVLFRLFLFAILIYLIVRMIREFLSSPKQDDSKMSSSPRERKVSKDVGEYVEFEEINGKEQGAKSKESRASDKEKNTRDFR